MGKDVLFINPGNAAKAYQELSTDYAAIEPPTWALLLAESVRSVGYNPAILDVNAERLSTSEAVARIDQCAARLLCFVVYGQNPNSGTVNMSGAVQLANAVKSSGSETPVCIVGSHVSALPLDVLNSESSIDFVLCNEGVYALRNVLAVDTADLESLVEVKGLGIRLEGKAVLTHPERVVPQERMDIDLPGYAWDLLPYREKPLDLYRSHFWHAEYDHRKRTPFAAIYTSLGCVFKCGFCMINVINREDTEDIGVAESYAKMRFWSPEFMIREFDKLIDLGVRTLRISDEMFLLNSKYFVPLCKLLCDRGYGEKLNMWAYSRVDTVRKREHLDLLRAAGIRWLALGIESGKRTIRLEAAKGRFDEVDIHQVVKEIESADINVIGNYLFGLPGEDRASMEATLQLGFELCTVAWNGYPVMALPGSSIYKAAVDKGNVFPSNYEAYSFLGYDTQPLPTDSLTPEEILGFRDRAFTQYHTYPPFLAKVKQRLGDKAVNNIQQMSKVRLKRKLLTG